MFYCFTLIFRIKLVCMNAVQPQSSFDNSKKIIFHVDFNSFFASVEQQLNPAFRGRPLGVTATNGRTCIIASSREAKRLGINTGERTYVARKICPEILFTSSHFEKYWQISQKFLNICSSYSPFVELFSLDEVFMDITPTIHLFGSVENIISLIKSRIKNEIGEFITVSVGVSHNKLLSKLASGKNKPNGVGFIGVKDIDSIYGKIKPTDICGIGERMGIRLERIGIKNLLQIRNYSKEKLILEFGPSYAQVLIDMSWGIDGRDVVPYYMPSITKSVGRNYCLPENECDRRVVAQNLYELCEEVGLKLRRLNKKAKTVGVSLRGNCDIHGRKTYSEFFDSGSDIFNRVMQIVDAHKCFQFKEYIRQISIWATNLQDIQVVQPSLFEDYKKDKIQKIVDGINDRFGDHTIRNGFLLYSPKLKTVPNGWMADRYERFKLSMS